MVGPVEDIAAATNAPKPGASAAMAAEGVDRLEVEPVNAGARRALYKARIPIYPKRVHGLFRRLKWIIMALTLGVYYGLPWLRWPRALGEPDQAVLVDFEGRRFYFFFIEIWPDELFFLTGLLILASLGLFLVTALFGRVWCGYACPQTVWTDLYLAIERWAEGDRNARTRLAKAPWSVSKLRKKVLKHVLWLITAAATGGAWIFYFHDAPTTLGQLFVGEAKPTAYLFLGILTFTTYTFAGSLREQVCTYMCPWPRIQAALTDEHALNVTYRTDRGEPRGAHKKGDSWEGRGDCVDCKACVAACPMGIDIRDGAQIECIHCALCIDACDDIMGKVGRPQGLIAYDTDANIERRLAGEATQQNLVRPRTVLYAGLVAIISVIMIWALSTRGAVEVNAIRDRAPPYVTLSDGSVRNAYTIKIVNKANHVRDFLIHIEGPDALAFSALGVALEGESVRLTVKGDEVRSLRVFITAPAESGLSGATPLTFVVEAEDGETAISPSSFLSGVRE